MSKEGVGGKPRHQCIGVGVNSAKIAKRQDIAVEAAIQAGRMLSRRFGHIGNIRTKGDRDFVTDVDLAAEKIIKRRIIKNFPGDNILSEEDSSGQESKFAPRPRGFAGKACPARDKATGFKWIIDPLDGTHNFIHNIGIFGVSIALAYRERIVLGVIYMPGNSELYYAQKGKGTYLNGRRISVSQRGIKQATLIFDSSIRYQKKAMLKALGGLVDQVFNVRMFGSTARGLTYIAEGKADVEVEYNDKVWDFAAGLLLIEEAGGKVTDLSGGKWNLKTRGYVASNGKIHNQVLSIIE